MKEDETILEKLKESIMSKEVDSKGVEDASKNVDNPDDAAEIIERIERIMKSKKNNVLMLAYQQGVIYKKYKEDSKFSSTVTKIKISKATAIDDYPKMRKSSISLHFLKNNFRVIKGVCKEYAS